MTLSPPGTGAHRSSLHGDRQSQRVATGLLQQEGRWCVSHRTRPSQAGGICLCPCAYGYWCEHSYWPPGAGPKASVGPTCAHVLLVAGAAAGREELLLHTKVSDHAGCARMPLWAVGGKAAPSWQACPCALGGGCTQVASTPFLENGGLLAGDTQGNGQHLDRFASLPLAPALPESGYPSRGAGLKGTEGPRDVSPGYGWSRRMLCGFSVGTAPGRLVCPMPGAQGWRIQT